jgi:hypothetical protein
VETRARRFSRRLTGYFQNGGAPGGGGSTGGTGAFEEVPLTPTHGWIASATNFRKVQGTAFAYADSTSWQSLTSDITGTNACIAGPAAPIDLVCIPPAGTDCYGVYWVLRSA